MSCGQNLVEALFDDDARGILYSLVYRKDLEGCGGDNDDAFQPTISAVFRCFGDIASKFTPDLYSEEWRLMVRSLEDNALPIPRFPSDPSTGRLLLVASLEDLPSSEDGINHFELSKKIAGFDELQICSVFWHLQRYFVAERRGETYKFPEIAFKG